MSAGPIASGAIPVAGSGRLKTITSHRAISHKLSTFIIYQGLILGVSAGNLIILENVMLPLVPIKMSAQERKEIAMVAIKEVNLEEKINHLPGELSGGEQQRVAIARALVNNPLIILADEPTGNLDTKTGEKIVLLLRKVNYDKNCSVIISTHDPKIADLTERKIILEDSKIVKKE